MHQACLIFCVDPLLAGHAFLDYVHTHDKAWLMIPVALKHEFDLATIKSYTVGCSRIWFYKFYSFPSTVERSAANTGTPMRVGQGLYESHIAKLPRADSTLQVK